MVHLPLLTLLKKPQKMALSGCDVARVEKGRAHMYKTCLKAKMQHWYWKHHIYIVSFYVSIIADKVCRPAQAF